MHLPLPRSRAALYMSGAGLLFSLTAVCIKALPASMPVAEKILARSVVAGLVSGALLLRGRARWRPGRPGLLLIRCLLGGVGMITYFEAVEGLPVGEAVALNMLNPFVVVLLAALLLRERFRPVQGLALLLAFTGAMGILQPGRLPITPAGWMALASALFSGAAYTCLRALRRTDRPETIVFWFSVVLVAIFLPATLAHGVMPTGTEALLLLGVGLGGGLGQLLMTAAYRHAPGGEVAIYNYLHVAFSLLWQTLLWQDAPGLPALAGAGLIVVGAWLNGRGGRKRPSH